MNSEPFITDLHVTSVVLLEISGDGGAGLYPFARDYPRIAFLACRSSLAWSLWLDERDADRAALDFDAVLPDTATVRVVRDLTGIVVGIERLDYRPQLPSRIITELAHAGAHVFALQSTLNGLRLVTNAAFTRSRDVTPLVEAACFRGT